LTSITYQPDVRDVLAADVGDVSASGATIGGSS
jgi:hypothetical protein